MLAVIILSLVSGARSLPIGCNIGCEAQYRPVCGSDGKTYNNACELGITTCDQGQGVTPIVAVHTGTCNGTVPSGGYIGCQKICNEQRSPVCASNGIVYENRCLYTIAHCVASQTANGTRLTVVSYTSYCPTPTKPNCEGYSKNVTDLAIEGPLGGGIRIVCPHLGHEVCTNHGTFKSECELCRSIETKLDKLQHNPSYVVPEYNILYEGPCHHSG